jgi:hypothetical protein
MLSRLSFPDAGSAVECGKPQRAMAMSAANQAIVLYRRIRTNVEQTGLVKQQNPGCPNAKHVARRDGAESRVKE